MDPRQQRGLEIATQFRVRRTIGGWIVPSQSGSGKYAVIMGETPTCTCPDFETRGVRCKHVFAVEHVIERERTPDGTTRRRRRSPKPKASLPGRNRRLLKSKGVNSPGR